MSHSANFAQAMPLAKVIRLVPRNKPDTDGSDILTSLRLDISRAGMISREPLLIDPAHALALLRILLPVASHALTVHCEKEAGTNLQALNLNTAEAE